MDLEKTIYVQLLGEGTLVYRPVPAIQIGENLFQLKGEDIANQQDEEWEFLPGTIVSVEQRELSEGIVWVANCPSPQILDNFEK